MVTVSDSNFYVPGFLGLSRKFIRKSLVVMFVALMGVGYTLLSQAATEPSVRFVFLCAQDACNTSYGSTSTVDTRAKDARDWYASKLGDGRTFRMLPTVKMTGSHTAAYYRGYGAFNAVTTLNNINNEAGLHEPNVKSVFILGFHSMDHCGVGAQGNTAVVDPFQGCGGNQNSVYAHELGHTWGLGHTTDGTLMNQPYACSGRTLSNCSLNSSQRSFLLNNASSWFPTSTSTIRVAPPPVTTIGDRLQAGQALQLNQQLVSPGGRFRLVLQTDSSLVLYDYGTVKWSANSYNSGASQLAMQGDGNLVLYTSSMQPIWWSNSPDRGATWVALQDDGNLVIYTPSNDPAWSIDSGLLIPWPAQPDSLYAGQYLLPGQYIMSPNRKYAFVLQGDGNLVLYNVNFYPVWTNNTSGRNGGILALQADGTLAQYDVYWNLLWYANNSPGSRLTMQTDGNLVLYNSAYQPVWASWTVGR